MTKTTLFIIDPQSDFCDDNGALSVPGAYEDMQRVSDLITRAYMMIDDISITLDSHSVMDIGHPTWWKRLSDGGHPDPFTLMQNDYGQVVGSDGKVYTTSLPGQLKWSLYYLAELESRGRYKCCVWPEHCLIGSKGFSVVQPLLSTLHLWERTNYKLVNKITKGSNPKTEHYSALVADVPCPNDHSTSMNVRFLDTIKEFDTILLAGEASSHCVKFTVLDMLNSFPDDSFAKKCKILSDCMSAVPGFEQEGIDFIEEAKSRGVEIIKSTDLY